MTDWQSQLAEEKQECLWACNSRTEECRLQTEMEGSHVQCSQKPWLLCPALFLPVSVFLSSFFIHSPPSPIFFLSLSLFPSCVPCVKSTFPCVGFILWEFLFLAKTDGILQCSEDIFCFMAYNFR